MNNEILRVGKLEIDSEELINFIIKSKKKGYAGDGKYVKTKDGSKVFTFQDRDFHYEDRFWGSIKAHGREIVRWKNESGQGIWFMSYSGGMLPRYWGDKELTKDTFAFLKKALMQITPEKPFRGPKEFKEGSWIYSSYTTGNISQFRGDEKISKNIDRIVFGQDYIGGLIIPK